VGSVGDGQERVFHFKEPGTIKRTKKPKQSENHHGTGNEFVRTLGVGALNLHLQTVCPRLRKKGNKVKMTATRKRKIDGGS